MALGRSNSLSLNTSAVNSSFANQQGQTQNQPQQPATGGGNLFGGSLFGTQNNQPQASQPAGSSTLFGGQTTTQTTQPTLGGSLFGNVSSNTQNTQQPFGTGSSLSGQTILTQNPQPTAFGGSLFGGQSNQPKAAGSSLFGATQNTQQQPGGGVGLFGATQANSTQQSNGPLFSSLHQSQAQTSQPSLLSASRYTMGQPAPFTGRLTMGQGSEAQTSAAPATKLNWDNVRPTTRFSDLVDPAKEQLESIDKMIQQQEAFCKQIEAFLPVHANNMESLQPDVNLITEKCEDAEQSLITDAQGVQVAKGLTVKDAQDVLRCERVGENLRLPSQYVYAPAASMYNARKQQNAGPGDSLLDTNYDVDLVSNYFLPATDEMRRVLETYQSNLGEIESHIQTIEATAVAQAQLLSQQRASGDSGDGSVRQLAETLRGFESTILATASKVGACREGVNDVVLGKAGGSKSGRSGW